MTGGDADDMMVPGRNGVFYDRDGADWDATITKIISNPISTVAVGVTASFGTVLLAAGTKGRRYALPHATVHMHQPLGGAQGQAGDRRGQRHQDREDDEGSHESVDRSASKHCLPAGTWR